MVKVSVIIPVGYLSSQSKSCFKSVLKQSESNIEIIIVEDGLDEKSDKIIADIFSDKPNARIIRQNKGGVSKARNLGLAIA